MIKKIQNMIMALALPFTFAAPVVLSTSVAMAACSPIASKVAAGADSTTTETGTISDSGDCGTDSLNDSSVGTIGQKIVTIFSEIVGVISIVMIVYGGFRYITSGGDSGRVGNAKNTIIYAIVGLIVVALAQAIVHYVLSTSATATSGSA